MKLNKIKKFIISAVIAGIVIILLYIVGNHYWINKKYEYITSYLNHTYNGKYTIEKCDYKKYDLGITAGMNMYSFEVSDSIGNRYVLKYNSYEPLCEQNVEKITIEKK